MHCVIRVSLFSRVTSFLDEELVKLLHMTREDQKKNNIKKNKIKVLIKIMSEINY
jgi:hypothetical protein